MRRSRGGVWRARGAMLLLALAACTDLLGPRFPSDARQLTPTPVQYVTWWKMTEACSGLHGDFNKVHWYKAAEDPVTLEGRDYDGYWFGDHHRIVLGSDHAKNGGTVRHEMLHDLLKGGGHPAEYFVVRCGALAPCGTACPQTEDDRGVPANARVIPSDSLDVTMSIGPQGAPSIAIDSGWMTITVTATNHSATPVWVRIPDSGAFGYYFARAAGTVYWSGKHRWAFRAGESRSLAFDCQMPPGTTDTLWAVFGHAHSRPLALSVAR